jgi:hypothetical protein
MATVIGTSVSGDAAVAGTNTASGAGVWGTAQPQGRGVVGVSPNGAGVWGHVTDNGRGVVGVCDGNGTGLWGETKTGRAIVGAIDQRGTAVWGEVNEGDAIVAVVKNGSGTGISGTSPTGDGVRGTGRRGVVGESPDYQGVFGHSGKNAGVVGESDNFHAMFAISHSPTNAGIFATNDKGGLAGHFVGDVTVDGHLHATRDVSCPGADCAEDFDVEDVSGAEPGTVMVITDEGRLRVSDADYDRRVAGVISGAGEYRPALVMDRRDGGDRRALALVGKVFCKVDATSEPIGVGDLLTTSAKAGHAMKVVDPGRGFGSVIGKALAPLAGTTGLIPVLVSLQ